LHQIRANAVAWYDRHARDLPWRRTHDPYAIWVSEIMLQQTQVATVIDYFHRFLAAYPDVRSLASAEEQSVLRLWSGLGYYRRARQLHAAAKQIVARGGEFPKSLDEILSLPGIGRYTAGAIASFAYDQPAPIVEANTQRLFSRLIRLEIDPRSRDGQAQLWSFAGSLVDESADVQVVKAPPLKTQPTLSPGRINQAVMELGSQICTPRDPDCPNCPLSRLCPTFAAGLQTTLPIAAPKKVITDLTHIALLIRKPSDENLVLMRQNAEDEWWHGLWDLPRVDVSHSAEFHAAAFVSSGAAPGKPIPALEFDWLAGAFHAEHALNCAVGDYHGSWKHAVTRYRIALHAFAATLAPRTRIRPPFAWHSIAEALDLPLTAPAKRLLRSLQ